MTDTPEAVEPPAGLSDDQIKHMVDRFLTWKLPETFAPDGGVTFEPISPHHPVGTNIFTAAEAEAMVRHMLEGAQSGQIAPDATLSEAPAPDPVGEAFHDEQVRIWSEEIIEAMALADVLKVETYDDKVSAYRAVEEELKAIGRALAGEDG